MCSSRQGFPREPEGSWPGFQRSRTGSPRLQKPKTFLPWLLSRALKRPPCVSENQTRLSTAPAHGPPANQPRHLRLGPSVQSPETSQRAEVTTSSPSTLELGLCRPSVLPPLRPHPEPVRPCLRAFPAQAAQAVSPQHLPGPLSLRMHLASPGSPCPRTCTVFFQASLLRLSSPASLCVRACSPGFAGSTGLPSLHMCACICVHARPWPSVLSRPPRSLSSTAPLCVSVALLFSWPPCLSPLLSCACIQCTLPAFLFSPCRRLYLCVLALSGSDRPLRALLLSACPPPGHSRPRPPLCARHADSTFCSPLAPPAPALPFSFHPALCPHFTSRCPLPSPGALPPPEGPPSACRPAPLCLSFPGGLVASGTGRPAPRAFPAFFWRSARTRGPRGMDPIRLTACDVTGALHLLIGRLTHARGNKCRGREAVTALPER